MISVAGAGGRSSFERLPLVLAEPPARLTALLLMAFAAAWGIAPLAGFVSSWPEPLADPTRFLALVFPVIAIGIELFALHLFVARSEVEIDHHRVGVERRGLFGREAWQEDLRRFTGVRLVPCRIKRGKRSVPGLAVDLAHPERERTIRLLRTTDDVRARTQWEQVARLLDLRAIEASAEGDQERAVADLDRSVVDLLEEGRVGIDYERIRGGAEGVAAEIDAGTLVITRTGPNTPLWLGALVTGFPFAIMVAAVLTSDMPAVAFWLGLLVFLLCTAGVGWHQISRERLRVKDGALRISALTPWFETAGRSLPVGEVETLVIKAKKAGERPALVIAGDRAQLRFGQWLPRESLESVRAMVLAKVDEDRRR